jgi:hypothetical protein
MAAKVTERLWKFGDIVDVLEAWEATDVGASAAVDKSGGACPGEPDTYARLAAAGSRRGVSVAKLCRQLLQTPLAILRLNHDYVNPELRCAASF